MTARPTALVLRALYLGDAITGLPALRMLRAARPDHRIVLAAPASVGQLALTAGAVDAVTPALELAPLTDAPRGADVAVDLHGNGPASRELLAATGAYRIVSYVGGDASARRRARRRAMVPAGRRSLRHGPAVGRPPGSLPVASARGAARSRPRAPGRQGRCPTLAA